MAKKKKKKHVEKLFATKIGDCASLTIMSAWDLEFTREITSARETGIATAPCQLLASCKQTGHRH